MVQVPKQGRDLHRLSAFQVLPVEQVPTIKWNLLHLALNLRRPARNLRQLARDLRQQTRNLRRQTRDLRRTARNLQLQFH